MPILTLLSAVILTVAAILTPSPSPTPKPHHKHRRLCHFRSIDESSRPVLMCMRVTHA